MKSYDIADLLDEIASADPPAYLRRCFAEGAAAAHLSWSRVQQLAACAMIVDAVTGGGDYEGLEPELIADWRARYAADFHKLKGLATRALQRATGPDAPPADAEAASELQQLLQRLAAA